MLWNRFFAPNEGDGSKSDKSSDKSTDKEEQDDEEEEDSEDTTDEEQDDDEEGEEDEEDISKKYFTDPNSLDPKLRGSFKKMQGIFTRKMQELSRVSDRAEAFDLLVADPEFQEWAEARRNGKVVGKTKSKSDDDDTDEDTPVTKKDLKAFMSSLTQQQTLAKQEIQIEEEAEQFKEDNPDWEMYKQPMLSIFKRYPKMSYQDAYDLARSKELKDDSEAETIKAKKRANTQKPNRTGAKDEGKKKGKMSVREAWDLAVKNMSKK